MSSQLPFNAPELTRGFLSVPLAAATLICAGVMVALNAAGNAVPATDAAGLRVIGRAEETIDNSGGIAGALNILVKPGIFQYSNSQNNAVTGAHVGKIVFVEDDTIVATTSTNKVAAGRVVRVDSEGVFVELGSRAGQVSVALASTNGVAAAAADLAALKAESEKIGDDVRAIHAALVALGLVA